MKTATPVPAILTIHQLDDGAYLIRVDDLQYRLLVREVAKLLEDARQLVLVTPANIQVLRVSGNNSARGESGSVASRSYDAEGADPQVEESAEIAMESLDAETQAAIREQEEHLLPGSPPAEPEVSAEKGMRVVRRQKSNGRAGHPETCGRCRGEGKIQIIDESGGPGEALCGVCHGKGEVTRYGARR